MRSGLLLWKVAQRAAEVWGSDEKLEEERSKRLENKNKMKNKKFNKKMEGNTVATTSIFEKNVFATAFMFYA